MFGNSAVADKALQKLVNRRLERTGSQMRLTATVRQGTVTLTGALRYEKQRIPIMKAITGVSGVRQVVDRLQAPPKVKPPAAYQGGGGAAIRKPEVSNEPANVEAASGENVETASNATVADTPPAETA